MEPTEAFDNLEQALSRFTTQLEREETPSAKDRMNLIMLKFIRLLLKSIDSGRVYKVGVNSFGLGEYVELNEGSVAKELPPGNFKIEPDEELTEERVFGGGYDLPFGADIIASASGERAPRVTVRGFGSPKSYSIDKSEIDSEESKWLASELSDIADYLRKASDKRRASVKEMQEIADKINQRLEKYLDL